MSKVFELIKSDFYRYYGDAMGGVHMCLFICFLAIVPLNESFKYTFWLRLSQNKTPLYPLARFMHWWLSHRYQVHINRHVKIGYGFMIAHMTPMVMNWKTEIGNNCTVYQFCSIGSSTGRAAKIGNNVYIGPHASIVGEVTIGDNVTIGAGSVVTKDVPNNATVVGTPAKVISLQPKFLCPNIWKFPS